MTPAAVARFWAKVDRAGSCWVWTGARNRNGYGYVSLGRLHRVAHRIAYEQLVGPIADGMKLDHLCRNRVCVNPAHLEPVTNRVNILRGDTLPAAAAAQTHCANGHELIGANLRWHRSRGRRPWRDCRQCEREAWMRRSAVRAAEGSDERR